MLTIRNFESTKKNGEIFRAGIITIEGGKITVNGIETTPAEFNELTGGGFFTFAKGETTNEKETKNAQS